MDHVRLPGRRRGNLVRVLGGAALTILLGCAPSSGSCPAPTLTVQEALVRPSTPVQIVEAGEPFEIDGSDWSPGCDDAPGCVHRSREPYAEVTIGVVRAEGEIADVHGWTAVGSVRELGTERPSDDLSFSLDDPVTLTHPGKYMLVATSPLGEDIAYGWIEVR